MSLELDLEDKVREIATRHGWICRKLQWVGRRSAMDRVFFGHGRCVFIEFKRRGEVLTKLQQREFDRLAARYPDIHVCDTLSKALGVLRIQE